jgi:two-component system sensor histidine kinase UhpB
MPSQNINHKRFTFSNLNTQLFFFVILPISILLLGITFGSVKLHQDAMRNLVGERDQRTVRSAAAAIREQLNHRSAAIQSIAIRADDTESLEEILDSVYFLMDDFDGGIAFFSPDGQLKASKGEDQLWNVISDQIPDYVSKLSIQLEDTPLFAEPFSSPSGNEFYSIVLFQADENSPVAVGVFSVTNLARQTLSGILSFENRGAVVLVDQEEQLLFRSGALDLSDKTRHHPGVSEALMGESGTTYFMAEDGEHVVAFSPVSPTNWALVIEEPWDMVASPLLRYSETGSLVLAPIVVFALFALWFGTRKIIQPLNRFQRQAVSFTQGNYEAFKEPVGGITEIQTLQNTFIDMAEQIQIAQQTLKNFLGLVTTGQEEERKRLARELHDETLQSLIALNQRVMMVRRQAEFAGVQESLLEIEAMIAQAMQELRRLTRALRPIYLEDLGLVAALEMLAMETSEASQIPVKFTAEGEEIRLPDHVEIAVFRISQETLSNIMRHSEATNAEMVINFKPKGIVLTISDNGKGFIPPSNPADLSNIGHYGLLGIHERAELIGANITIQSGLGHGSKISLQIPM